MKNIILVLTVFFLVEYGAYSWDPCGEEGNCLTIYCPGGVCETPAHQFFVKTLEEVREIIDKNGTKHLQGMYRIEWNGNTKHVKVIPLKLVPSYEIEEE